MRLPVGASKQLVTKLNSPNKGRRRWDRYDAASGWLAMEFEEWPVCKWKQKYQERRVTSKAARRLLVFDSIVSQSFSPTICWFQVNLQFTNTMTKVCFRGRMGSLNVQLPACQILRYSNNCYVGWRIWKLTCLIAQSAIGFYTSFDEVLHLTPLKNYSTRNT